MYRSKACDALKILATQAAKYDKDGIDIYFINDLKVTNGVKVSAFASRSWTVLSVFSRRRGKWMKHLPVSIPAA